MIKTAQNWQPPKEARNFQVQLPLVNNKLLHRAILKARTSDISSVIHWEGGMDLPDPIEAQDIIVFSSTSPTQINPEGIPTSGSSYIYTMSGIVVEKPREGLEKKKIIMTAGWTKKEYTDEDGVHEEWVLVVFTPKWKNPDGTPKTKSSMDIVNKYSHDFPKKAGKQFYEEVYVSYATMTVGDELLNRIGFEELAVEGGYGLALDFNTNQYTPLGQIRRQLDGPPGQIMPDGSVMPSTANPDDPNFNLAEGYDDEFKEFYLYTRRSYSKKFELPITIPGRNTPRTEWPTIRITIDFSSLFPPAIAAETDDPITPRPRPTTVSVFFENTPDDLPPVVFQSIEKFLVQGLEGDWMNFSMDQSSSAFKFRQHGEGTNESISRMLDARSDELQGEIDNLAEQNIEFGLRVQTSAGGDVDERTGNPRDPLSKVLNLDNKKLNVEKNLPMDLGDNAGHTQNTLSWKLKEFRHDKITPSNINLMKLMIKEE